MPQRPPARLSIQQIVAMAKARGLDPDAVLRVARVEGLSGGIGDNGHAFGPWQLNNSGGVLTGRFRGQSPEQINEWAWSPAGVSEALGGISKVAGGLRGGDAVRAIVTKYERPADPGGEIARALGSGGGGPSGPSGHPAATPAPTGNPGAPPSPGTNPRRALLLALAGAAGTGDYSGFYKALAGARERTAVPSSTPVAATSPSAPVRGGGNGLAELLHEGVGGPTHSTGEHIHAAFTDPKQELRAIRLAEQLGLQVRENPYTDPVDPVHAKNSYHYRKFPGTFNGRTLGQAFDASGAAPAMSRYYAALAKQYGRT